MSEGTYRVLQRALERAKNDLPARLRLRADDETWRDSQLAADMRKAADEIEMLHAMLGGKARAKRQ